jgi:hypothetical protein
MSRTCGHDCGQRIGVSVAGPKSHLLKWRQRVLITHQYRCRLQNLFQTKRYFHQANRVEISSCGWVDDSFSDGVLLPKATDIAIVQSYHFPAGTRHAYFRLPYHRAFHRKRHHSDSPQIPANDMAKSIVRLSPSKSSIE